MRTAPVATGADRLIVQLVNAHEGPLDGTTLARVNVGGNAAGSGAIRFRGAVPARWRCRSPIHRSTAPDDLPLPRMAVLPDGRLETSINLFPTGPVDPILRPARAWERPSRPNQTT